VARPSAKIAISISSDLLDDVERVRRTTGETRSAVVARAVRLLVDADKRRAQIAEYVEAYRRHPETAAEVRAVRTVARRTLENLPWDE
jgi:metal-responsive CopG/Arc/MetJ family transcriptional regulator